MTPLFDSKKPNGKGNDPKFKGIYQHIGKDGGRTLYIAYRDHGGRSVRKRVFVKTPTDAARLLAKTLEAVREAKEKIARDNAKIKEDDYLPAGVGRPASESARMKDAITVADIIDHHMSAREAKGRGANIKKDRHQLEKHFAAILKEDANRVRSDHIEAQLEKMRKAGLNPKTINNALKCLRAVYARAEKDKIAKINPCENIEDYKEREFERKRLKVDEVDNLLQSAKEAGDNRLYLFLLIMARTGARPEAVLRLQGKDLIFKDRLIKFPALKDGLPVAAPMIGKLADELAALNVAPEHYVIHKTRDGGKEQEDRFTRGNYEAIRRQAKRFFDEYFGNSSHGVTLYTLRHSAATQLLRHGVDIAHVSRLLGHKDIKTTMIYAESDGETLLEVIEKAGIWG